MKNITKKQLTFYSIVWLLGVLFMLLANTDFFEHGPVFRGHLMMWLLMIGSTIAVISFHVKYYKAHRNPTQ